MRTQSFVVARNEFSAMSQPRTVAGMERQPRTLVGMEKVATQKKDFPFQKLSDSELQEKRDKRDGGPSL